MFTFFTQSGHIGAVPQCCGYFDEGFGKILVQQVSCSGPEENVTSCSYSNSTLPSAMKETFVWWEYPTAGRVEWRYICMENGELLLITLLMHYMLMWCADSLDMTLDVKLIR